MINGLDDRVKLLNEMWIFNETCQNIVKIKRCLRTVIYLIALFNGDLTTFYRKM